MFRLAPAFLLLIPTASTAGPGEAPQVGAAGGDCKVTRILKDGREIRSMSPEGVSSSTRADASGGSSSVSVQSRPGSARSSVSASSSSSSNGNGGSARAMSSHTDEHGRTVTTTRDENGCTIVIDERGT
jgi:hypothetical protein